MVERISNEEDKLRDNNDKMILEEGVSGQTTLLVYSDNTDNAIAIASTHITISGTTPSMVKGWDQWEAASNEDDIYEQHKDGGRGDTMYACEVDTAMDIETCGDAEKGVIEKLKQGGGAQTSSSQIVISPQSNIPLT